MRGIIFTSIINPVIIWGVSQSFAFLILFLFFAATIFIRPLLGNEVMFVLLALILAFYRYSINKTREDPFWFNIFVMALVFERRDPITFVRRLISGREKRIFR